MVRRAQNQHQGSFQLGDLMCVSVAREGITTSLRLRSGMINEYHSETPTFWLYESEILIGVVVEERFEPLRNLHKTITEYRVLTPMGLFWFSLSWSSSDDLCIQLLTTDIADYITHNARWNDQRGVWVWNDKASRFP